MTENQPSVMETQPSLISVALKYGLLTGLISIIYTLFSYLTETFGSIFLNLFIALAITIIGLVLAMREFRKKNGGFMTYGQGLGIGMIVAVTASILSGIFIFLYTSYVDPTITEKIVDSVMDQMGAFGLDDSQLDEARDKMLADTTPFKQLTSALTNGLFGGLILSLIIAAIMKRNRPEFE